MLRKGLEAAAGSCPGPTHSTPSPAPCDGKCSVSGLGVRYFLGLNFQQTLMDLMDHIRLAAVGSEALFLISRLEDGTRE